MSSIAVQGGATGTGLVTVVAPSTSTNRTLTLPDVTATLLSTATPGVPVNGPAFSAYASGATTLVSNTSTKIQFQAEEFDTNNCFDSTTNYRFTPTVAGYYQICGGSAITANGTYCVFLFKNGSSFKSGVFGTVDRSYISCLVYLNGSTDYLELYGYPVGFSPNAQASQTNTYFQAAMVRAA